MNIASGTGFSIQSLGLGATPSAATNETGQMSGLKKSTERDTLGMTVSGPGSETNHISVAGRLMQASAGQDVRSERVAALQQAIAAGTYSIPAAAIADKLMKSMVG